jgi:hypothetical protein
MAKRLRRRRLRATRRPESQRLAQALYVGLNVLGMSLEACDPGFH